jgi:hypothetical protein
MYNTNLSVLRPTSVEVIFELGVTAARCEGGLAGTRLRCDLHIVLLAGKRLIA